MLGLSSSAGRWYCWPKRWTRAIACASDAKHVPGSRMISLEALVSVSPTAAAFIERMKTCTSAASLKADSALARWAWEAPGRISAKEMPS